MLVERLTRRCPSARPIATAIATRYEVRFDKIGRDNSAKATLFKTGDKSHNAPGVIFKISVDELPALDDAEGDGYLRLDDFAVTRIDDNASAITKTYIARSHARDKSLKPFNWYRDLCVAGAKEAGLPRRHIDYLSDISASSDPQPDRPGRLEALEVIRSCFD